MRLQTYHSITEGEWVGCGLEWGLNIPCFFFCFFLCLYPAEESVSCENPGLPDNGYQILSKRLYLPGESLTFVCYQGYELIGEDAIKCIMGTPSFWSGPLPFCMGETAQKGFRIHA